MNVSLVIPQIFYDLIARVAPGLAVLAGLYFAYPGHVTPAGVSAAPGALIAWESNRLFALLGLTLAAYVTAFLLEGLWALVEPCCDALLGPTGRASSNEGRGGIEKDRGRKSLERTKKEVVCDFNRMTGADLTVEAFPGIPLMYDFIRLRNAEAGARLVKLRAEASGCRTMALGWTIAFLVNTYNAWYAGLPGCLLEVALVVGTVAIWCRHAGVTRRFEWGVCNHFLLLGGQHANGVPPQVSMDRLTDAAA